MCPIIALCLIALIAAGCWAWLSIAVGGGDPVRDGHDQSHEDRLSGRFSGAGKPDTRERQA